jgi:type III secretion protein U
MSEKTEDPTPKRLRKAEEEGDSGASQYAARAVAFLVTITLLPAAVSALAHESRSMLMAAVERAGDADPHVGDPTAIGPKVVMLALPVLLAAGITGAVASLVQTGAVIATKKLSLDLGRLNVFEGVKNLLSAQRLFSVVRALLGGAAVAYLALRGLRSHALDLAHLPGQLGYVPIVAGEVARTIARDAALLGLAIGAVDLLVVRRSYWNKLKMSKEEVKREYKESEGDPQVKAARERAHHEMLAAATVSNVKNATVVIVNPTHIATALRYDEKEGDEAPVVVANGEGDLARRIVEAAHAYGVPVLRDVPLARLLAELEVGDAIPEALYEAVAEILREAWDEKARATETGKGSR